jgi:hypothetical protein
MPVKALLWHRSVRDRDGSNAIRVRKSAAWLFVRMCGLCARSASCVFEPEQRLTVGLYGLAAILMPFWERGALSYDTPIRE